MNRCLEDDELVDLLDGGVPPNREEPLRRHLRACGRCTSREASLQKLVDDLADTPPFDPAAHAARVGRAIEAVARALPADAPPRERRRGARVAVLASFAVAASVALFVGTRPASDSWIAARGSSDAAASGKASVRHAAGVDLWAVETGSPRGLRTGDVVSASTRYQATYRNVGAGTFSGLVFGVDAAGAIHWLYPAYDTPGSDPDSVSLPPTGGKDAPLVSSVVLEGPAAGTLEIFALISHAPLRVSSIEGRHDLSLDALRRAFPDADVESISLRVTK